MSTVNNVQIAIPSSAEDHRKILSAITEASDCLVRISAERDLIKDIADDISKKYNIPKKFVNRMIRTHHKSNFNEQIAEAETFETLYQTVSKTA
jgi:hypothetical protein